MFLLKIFHSLLDLPCLSAALETVEHAGKRELTHSLDWSQLWEFLGKNSFFLNVFRGDSHVGIRGGLS